VSGLTGHPKTLGLDPFTFFMHLLELLSSKYPGFNDMPPERQLKIIGGIVDPQDRETFAHILYSLRLQRLNEIQQE